MTIPDLQSKTEALRSKARWVFATGLGALAIGLLNGADVVATIAQTGNLTSEGQIVASALFIVEGIGSLAISRTLCNESNVYLAEQLAQERQQTPPPNPAP